MQVYRNLRNATDDLTSFALARFEYYRAKVCALDAYEKAAVDLGTEASNKSIPLENTSIVVDNYYRIISPEAKKILSKAQIRRLVRHGWGKLKAKFSP